jgi:flagellar hook-basal body complex protein FliE
MAGIQGLGGVANPITSVGTPGPISASPFSGVLKGMMAQTGDLDQEAQQAVSGLLSGSGVDVHEAMIATQKADVAFELALQVRNKAVGAYQQMMSMQF